MQPQYNLLRITRYDNLALLQVRGLAVDVRRREKQLPWKIKI